MLHCQGILVNFSLYKGNNSRNNADFYFHYFLFLLYFFTYFSGKVILLSHANLAVSYENEMESVKKRSQISYNKY